MSSDKEKSRQESAKEEDRNIWRTDTTVSDDITVIERNALEIAEGAVRLAWAALWVSVIAVVISIAGTLVGLSL